MFRTQSMSGRARAGTWGSSPAPRCPLYPQGLSPSTALYGEASLKKEACRVFLLPPGVVKCVWGALSAPCLDLPQLPSEPDVGAACASPLDTRS